MRNHSLRLAWLSLIFVAALSSACSQLLGNLRRDMDDGEPYTSPTVGGRWTEKGMLADEPGADPLADRYAAVGHSERSPASGMYPEAQGNGSWVSPDDIDAQRRDAMRGKGMEGEQAMASLPKRNYKNGSRATRQDFVDESPNEGSLWASDGQTNYYFTKNKIRGVGDIVNITVEQDLVRDTVAEVARTLTPREREEEVGLAQQRLRAKALGIDDAAGATKDALATSSAAPAKQAAGSAGPQAKDATAKKDESDVDVPKATAADIDVSKSLSMKAGDTIMAEIVERYPNGNYKIRGTKRVPYRGGQRYVQLLGVVKGTDITEEDTVPSSKLYEYRLEATR